MLNTCKYIFTSKCMANYVKKQQHVYLCSIPTDHHQLLILTLYKDIYNITFMLTVLFFLVSNKIK